MNAEQGIFIVVEGADGSGKATQFKLLKERLRAVGYEVEAFDFPRYHKTSSHFVRRYLNGDYGPAKDISPYTAALFYALDRYEAAPAIRKALAAGKIVLSNRYVGSNMAHQGGKFDDPIAQRGFFVWEDGLEFQMLGIPRPNFNFFLRVPAEISYQLIGRKAKREYIDATRDEHENNIEHLRSTVAAYDTLCKLFPKDFQAIECAHDGKVLSVAAINDLLWEKLRPMLPKKPPHAAQDIVVKFDQKDTQASAHDQSNKTPNKEIPPVPAASVPTKNISLNIKKVSLLAISQIQSFRGVRSAVTSVEWPQNGHYEFYTPSGLPKNVAALYKQSIQKQLGWHEQLARDASNNPTLSEALAACTPMSALASARISGSAGQLLELIAQLQTNPLAEARWLAQQLLSAAKKLYPQDFKPGPLNTPFKSDLLKEPPGDIIAKLVSEHLPQTLPPSTEQVSLLEARPRNEFDLLLDSLYSYSSASRFDIAAELDSWSYQQKSEALLAAAAQPASDVLQQARYLWNIICDRTTFEHLKSALQLDDPKTQPPTPRFGYDVPEVVESAGLDEIFMECFDESLKLFSSLQAAGQQDIAAYATLLGHKNRWQFSTTAGSLRLANPVETSEPARLVSIMLEKVSEAHPLIGDFIAQKAMQSASNQTDPPKYPLAEKPNQNSKKRTRRHKK